MRILYISNDGMTDALGQSQVIPYLSGLSQLGYEISIVSSEKAINYQKLKQHIFEILNNQNISWHPVNYSKKIPLISQFLNHQRLRKKAYKLIRAKKYNIVHCRSYMASLVGLEIKKKLDIKFIFDMRGFWADERIDGQIWNIKNILHKQIYNYFKKKEIEFLLNADYIISLTQNAKNEILSWPDLKKISLPIQVIPCCVDLKLFSRSNILPFEQQELKHKLKINETDFIISYLGSIGTWYMLDEMLDFYSRISATKTNAKFLFITHGDKNEIISLAKLKNIPESKLIVQSANRNEVPLLLSLSDVSIYFIKPLYSKRASSATKTGELMAMGIPVITNTGVGDNDTIISDSGAGMLIEKFSDEEYDRIINQIDEWMAIDKSKIVAASEFYFSLEKGILLYEKVYQKLLD